MTLHETDVTEGAPELATAPRIAGDKHDDDAQYVDELIVGNSNPDTVAAMPETTNVPAAALPPVIAPTRMKLASVTLSANGGPVMLLPPDPFRRGKILAQVTPAGTAILSRRGGQAYDGTAVCAATAALTLTIPAVTGARFYLSGFELTWRGDGAGVYNADVQLTNLGATALGSAYAIVEQGANIPGQLIVNYGVDNALPATVAGTAAVLQVAANANSSAARITAHGYYLYETNPTSGVRFGSDPLTLSMGKGVTSFETDDHTGPLWVSTADIGSSQVTVTAWAVSG